ncbi:hypothetical protein [Porphyromonas sp. COT-108 OH1349]|uniref:hypothetical protein n=1 Tax=Porphyromonas sp. COT-108 OH1349 TaxID=1537504 RepID=UPI000689A3A1|nr:hypothetical protein [Porphyromonas sp. COT-108 OH1349]
MFQKLSQAVEELFKEGRKVLSQTPEASTHAFFLKHVLPENELLLLNDEHECLAKIPYESRQFNAMNKVIKEAVKRLRDKGFFYQDCFKIPFSVSMIGEENEVENTFLQWDSEVINLSKPLMPNLNKELNEFLRSLELDC